MSILHAIKQLEEKNVVHEINCMVWSDRMDLVALSNTKGEVALHRLTWTKAWSLSPPTEGLTVKGISWRPDGKILAIAYSSGHVILVKVENKQILNTIETDSEISCLHWVQEQVENKQQEYQLDSDEESTDYMKYIDFSAKFLPDPPAQSFDSSTASPEDGQKSNILQNQNELNLLLIGTADGFVHVNIFGCFLCAVIDLNANLGCRCFIENVHLTEDLSRMFVVIRDIDQNVKIGFIDSAIFKTHTKELFAIALKHVKLLALVNYLSSTISSLTETWESILLEMDNKLSKYASKVAEGGVTADFLDLLMFGMCSNEMEEFLMHDLTKKGLEKFGQTIEMSYTNIQELLLKYVTKYGQNITYHLAELRGMSQLEHRYKILGLSEEIISDSILSNGGFLIKGGEMQQIINHSIINYKAFFRWLYTAILHLMDEQIPNEFPKMTQQDLAYITEFLQNFDHIGRKNDDSSKHSGFIMERLGQYLSDSPLTIKPNMKGNDWTDFLEQNVCLQEHPSILKHFEDMSLVQQFKHLQMSIEKIFQTPKTLINQQFRTLHVMNCFICDKHNLKTGQISLSKTVILFAFLQPHESINLLQIQLNQTNCLARGGTFYFPQYLSYDNEACGENYQILDLNFYSNTILSVLLQENNANKTAVLYQMSLPIALEKLSEIDTNNDIYKGNAVSCINGSSLVPKLFKNIEGMIASQFAVSGSRRVGIVLAENKRKVRLFEMEGEEEDDEDTEMSVNISKDNDMSIVESTTS